MNMDYLLYRNTNESDPTYDYFAILTNVSASTDQANSCSEILIEHKPAYTSDEIIDYQPVDTYKANTINASLDFGLDVGGSIGVSYTTQSGPDIDATYSTVSDYASWQTKRRLLGPMLEDNLYKYGSSWASAGTLAGNNIKFRGYFYDAVTFFWEYSAWKTVQVRFDY